MASHESDGDYCSMAGSPVDDIMRLATGAALMRAVTVAAEIGIADILTQSPKGLDTLSRAADCRPAPLRRLLRALASLGLCEERENDCFALTAAGAVLRRDADESLHDWATWWGRYLWPEWGKLTCSVKTGQSARRMTRRTSGLDHLEDDTEAAAVFDGAMSELTRLVARSVIGCYDFSGATVVVDVAGGCGELLAAILRRYPRTRGVLFDRPHAIKAARDRFETAGLDERCDFVTGSFFESVPSGADVYVLKSVLHDWDDERSAHILRTCRSAMSSRARLLIIESIVPPRFRPCALHQDIARRDLTMLVGPGGRERTELEFRQLLAATRFGYLRIAAAQFGFFVIVAARSMQPTPLRR